MAEETVGDADVVSSTAGEEPETATDEPSAGDEASEETDEEVDSVNSSDGDESKMAAEQP